MWSSCGDAKEHQGHCILKPWKDFFNFCLGAEVFELKVQRTNVHLRAFAERIFMNIPLRTK